VRLIAIRNLDPKWLSAKPTLYCKVSLNNAHLNSGVYPVVNDAKGTLMVFKLHGDLNLFTGDSVVRFQDEVFHGLGIHSISSVSFDDLMVIRVKIRGSFGEQTAGVLSIAIKTVSMRGTHNSSAWYPFIP